MRTHAAPWLAWAAGLIWALAPGLGRGADAAPSSLPSASAPGGCGDTLDSRHRRLLPARFGQLAFAPQPAPIATGRHLGLDIVVCPRAGGPFPVALRVDADMPAHGHGMNYRPTVRALGNGRYRAEGLMLHMSGRWRLLFDVSIDGRIERLSHEVELP